MTTEIQATDLLGELARASWSKITGPEDDHQLEDAELSNRPGIVFRRKVAAPNQVYMGKAGSWQCLKCGTGILAGRVAHTIRDGLFPGSGGGDVWNEEVPYCPSCEKPPNFHGSPIRG